MQITFVIPGLAWPAASATEALRGLALPALSRLIGLGRAAPLPGHTLETWLPQASGLSRGNTPYAALRLLGEGGDPAAHHWLCADPSCLHFHRELLTLVDGSELAITPAEAAELVAGLNRDFRDLGEFFAPAPTRWYLRPVSPPAIKTHPLSEVLGRKLDAFLPEGSDARRWRGYTNEVQTWLHCHPVNRAREGNGQPLINNLWFWGEGAIDAPLQTPAQHMYADPPLARGLARASGGRASPLPASLAALPPGHVCALLVLDQLRLPALNLEIHPWQTALSQLEISWFAPALEQMNKGNIRQLHIVALGDRASTQISIEAGDRWKFWRRPSSLLSVLQA